MQTHSEIYREVGVAHGTAHLQSAAFLHQVHCHSRGPTQHTHKEFPRAFAQMANGSCRSAIAHLTIDDAPHPATLPVSCRR